MRQKEKIPDSYDKCEPGFIKIYLVDIPDIPYTSRIFFWDFCEEGMKVLPLNQFKLAWSLLYNICKLFSFTAVGAEDISVDMIWRNFGMLCVNLLKLLQIPLWQPIWLAKMY